MRKTATFLFFLFWSCFSVWAQNACFLAFNEQNEPVSTFCVGEKITFKDNSGQTIEAEYYDFDARDGLDFSKEQSSFTFTSPGEYKVTQLIGLGQTCERTFTVKATPPAQSPVLQALEVTSTGLKIKLNSTDNYDLVLQRSTSAAGPFEDVAFLSTVSAGETEHTIVLAQTEGCFRVRVVNLCTDEVTFISNILCAQDLIAVAGDRQNSLSWSGNLSPESVAHYQVFRNGAPYVQLPSSQNNFADSRVACGRSYTYAVAAVFTDGRNSTSNAVTVTTQGTTAPAAALLVASYNLENSVGLQTIVPEQETFVAQTIYKSVNEAVLGLFLEKQAKNSLDSTPFQANQMPCYQATYLDSCQLVSARSNVACPAQLLADYRPETGSVYLSWSNYQGFEDYNVGQTLQLLNDEGEVYWSTEVFGQSFVDQQPKQDFQRLRYRLLSSASQTDLQSFSNTVSIDQPFQFYFPTAFSPNGDGLNDVFRAVGNFASKFHLQVLNRWGQVVFESSSPQLGWDGTFNGKPALPETYLYRFEAEDVNGQRLVKSGKITLVR